jgi:hypothetical protein
MINQQIILFPATRKIKYKCIDSQGIHLSRKNKNNMILRRRLSIKYVARGARAAYDW